MGNLPMCLRLAAGVNVKARFRRLSLFFLLEWEWPICCTIMSSSDSDRDEWKGLWDAREAALTAVLGETDGMVLHAMIPFMLGGQADVVCFRKHITGRVAVTCELLGEPSQKRNDLGTYELMIAHRDDNDWGPDVISRLARYTCDAVIEPGDTMDIGSAVPKGSTITAFLFLEYARFKFAGEDAGLLLCLGITADELKACRAGKRDEVLAALKQAGFYPYTDLSRPSVVQPSGIGGSWRKFRRGLGG